MPADRLYIKCVRCSNTYDVTVYEGVNEGIDFTLEDAPVRVLVEFYEECELLRVRCPYCKLYPVTELKVEMKDRK